jgi:hypothetical protein
MYKHVPNPMGTTYIISDKEIKRLVNKFNASHLSKPNHLSLTGNTSRYGFEVVYISLHSSISFFINADLSFDTYTFSPKRSLREMQILSALWNKWKVFTQGYYKEEIQTNFTGI